MLDGTFGGEAVDDDGSRLADAVGAILRLEILLRVPVRVKKDDRVGRREVDSLASGTCAKEKKSAVFLRVEVFDLDAALVLFDGAVYAAAFPVVLERGPVFEDVECRFKLREDEDFVVALEEVREQAGEKQHLAGGCDKGRVRGGVIVPGPVEIVRRVASKAKLHDGILEFLVGDFLFCDALLDRK